MKTNVEIVGKYIPDNEDWLILHFQYLDDKMKEGIGCGNYVCSKSYADKLLQNLDKLAIGYDKEKRRNFLYVKKG